MTVGAHGEARLIASSGPEGGRAMNRRVEFIRVE
jgi:outer membrane protein OmpA-like peptidoglycan-associated protein